MSDNTSTIPCPVCKTKIPFDAMGLINGKVFQCPDPNCDASISLSNNSKPSIKSTMDKLDELKKLK